MKKNLTKNDIKWKAGEHIVSYCGNLRLDEKLLIIYDDTTENLVNFIEKPASNITKNIKKNKIEILEQHGLEPPSETAALMKESNLIIAITSKSLAHSSARSNACLNGARYLSLAEYTQDVLENEAIFGVKKDKINYLKKMEQILNQGKIVKINSSLGTSLELDIEKRIANNCPGFVEKPGELGSPPDMEVNISPIEEYSFGNLVVDGSITHPDLGLLKSPITLEIKKGRIYKIYGKSESKILNELFNKQNNEKTKILAELGIGFNEMAKLCGNMLIDEGAANCIHFGFGSNSTVGGKNEVSFHLDFVIKNADMFVDNVLIVKNGKPVL